MKTEWTPEQTPKLTEYAKMDADSRAFYSMLRRGDNPYSVIDEMAKYFVPNHQRQIKIIERLSLHTVHHVDISDL